MLLKELVLLLRNYNVFLLNNPLRMSFKGCIPGSEDKNSFFTIHIQFLVHFFEMQYIPTKIFKKCRLQTAKIKREFYSTFFVVKLMLNRNRLN